MIRIVFDFLWISVLVAILLGLISTIIPALGTSGSAVGTITGAMVAGQLYGRRTGVEASKSLAWRAAAAITIATLLFSGLVFVVLLRSGALEDVGEVSWVYYAVGIGFIGTVTLLIARYFFRWGSRTGAKSVGGPS